MNANEIKITTYKHPNLPGTRGFIIAPKGVVIGRWQTNERDRCIEWDCRWVPNGPHRESARINWKAEIRKACVAEYDKPPMNLFQLLNNTKA